MCYNTVCSITIQYRSLTQTAHKVIYDFTNQLFFQNKGRKERKKKSKKTNVMTQRVILVINYVKKKLDNIQKKMDLTYTYNYRHAIPSLRLSDKQWIHAYNKTITTDGQTIDHRSRHNEYNQ